MPLEVKAHEELKQVVEDLAKEIRDERSSMNDKHEKLDKMYGELQKQIANQERRAIFPEVNVEAYKALSEGTPEQRGKAFNKLILQRRASEGRKHSELIGAIQEKADEVIVIEKIRRACQMSGIANVPGSIWETETGQEYRGLVEYFQKAAGDVDFDLTGSAAWLPQDMSPNLREWVMMQMRVASLFDEIPQPTKVWDWPYVTGPPEATYVAESTDPADAFTAPSKDDQMFGGVDPSAGNQFDARKIRAFSFYSREWSEDTIKATLPWLMRQLPLAEGRAWEEMIINGDESATMDQFGAGATNVRRWGDGLRQYAIDEVGTWVGDTTDTHAFRFADDMGGTWDISKFLDSLRRQRKRMDKYGLRLNELAYVVSIDFYYQLMSLDKTQTLADLGPQARLLTGQVAAFDSIPVIVSEFLHLYEGSNATPALNGSQRTSNTEDSGSNLLVWRPGWVRTRRPGMAAEVVRYAHSDQYMVVLFVRGDFGPLEPSGTGGALTVNFGYDVPVF